MANKEIKLEKYNMLKKLKIKIIIKRKEKNGRRKKKGGKRKISQNCRSPMNRQRFITIGSVTAYTHIHIHP